MKTECFPPLAILGAGAWGTALAIHLGRHHQSIHLWGRRSDDMQAMQRTRCNNRYLPHQTLPESVYCTPDLTTALSGVKDILIVIPSHQFRSIITLLKPKLSPSMRLLWATKGLEPEQAQLLPTLVESELGSIPYAILSGPSFALEVAQALPTALTIASTHSSFATTLQKRFHQSLFRIYLSSDVIGVSLGGAMKNVLAIAVGISDGLGFGANARAALMTRGLAEMQHLGTALGAKQATFIGLSGIGDLSLTCMDNQSRNRRFGLAIGQGCSLEAAQQQLGLLSEGVLNTRTICQLAQRHSISLPICETVYAILFDGVPTKIAVANLLKREAKHDTEL